MRVSIVTISFNQCTYLERALSSVLGQDYNDLEYIVVDPGSTDGSRAIIERHRDRVAHVVLEPDLGPADGLNSGFALATGDVFGYLNSDDALFPWTVSQVVQEFRRDPHADLVCGHGYLVDAEDRPLRRLRSTPFSPWRYVHGGATTLQQATFFRRGVFLDVGGFNVENRSNWDGELLLDLALAGKQIKVVHRDWALFRLHEDSITGTKVGPVRENARRNQVRLFEKVMGRSPAKRDAVTRAFARVQKWLLDPSGFWIRVGEKLGRRTVLPIDAPTHALPDRGLDTFVMPARVLEDHEDRDAPPCARSRV